MSTIDRLEPSVLEYPGASCLGRTKWWTPLLSMGGIEYSLSIWCCSSTTVGGHEALVMDQTMNMYKYARNAHTPETLIQRNQYITSTSAFHKLANIVKSSFNCPFQE